MDITIKNLNECVLAATLTKLCTDDTHPICPMDEIKFCPFHHTDQCEDITYGDWLSVIKKDSRLIKRRQLLRQFLR